MRKLDTTTKAYWGDIVMPMSHYEYVPEPSLCQFFLVPENCLQGFGSSIYQPYVGPA